MSLPNAPTMNTSSRTFWALFWLLVFLHQLYFGWFLVRSDFVPYVMDGNETFSVWWHSHNLYTFDFWKSFGLTDESYGLTEASHPFFHTHQGNMPRLFGFLIYALGARTVEAQVLITTLVIGNLTLFFCYASIAKITRPALAFVFCLFLFSDYLLYAQWHVVTYRVWYGFIFFGTLFAISHAKDRIWPYALLGLLFFLLFYFELVFAVYVSIATALWAIWLHWGSPKRIATIYGVQLVAGIAALALLFTQLIMVFGLDVVKADFSTTFLARNASTANTYGSVEAFFRSHNIVFWNNFRDGDSLRTLPQFMRSIGNFVFQIWTPSFFIIIGVLFIGVLLSFFERIGVNSSGANFSKGVSSPYFLQLDLLDPDGNRRSRSLNLSRTLSWLAYVVSISLALAVVITPGVLFGFAPNRALETIVMIVLVLAIFGYLALFIFTDRKSRPAWMPTYRAVLTTALGSSLAIKSHVLFNQDFSDIWASLYADWKVRLILRGATLLAFTVAACIAAFGASVSFGCQQKRGVRRAVIFLITGFVAYAVIYMLSPGYVLSGYATRYAPFAIFFIAILPAISFYAMTLAARRFSGLVVTTRLPMLRRWTAMPLIAAVVGGPTLLWIDVQLYYVRLFPPDHAAFLQKLKSPPLHGATFAVDNYAAPTAYYAGNWAYFDTQMDSGAFTIDKQGVERLQDYSSRWFADVKPNHQYQSAKYYLCMKMPTFNSALELANPQRYARRFPFCASDKILNRAMFDDELVASDYPVPRFWSIVQLDQGQPKISDVTAEIKFIDDHWSIIPGLQTYPAADHAPTAAAFELVAESQAISCDVSESGMRVIAASTNSSDFLLPDKFTGAFRVRGRVDSDLGEGRWKSGDLWVIKPNPPGPVGALSRCPVIIIDDLSSLHGPALFATGWGGVDPWGTWTMGPHAVLQPLIIPASAASSDFILEANVRGFVPIPGTSQSVTVRANGIAVADWTLTSVEPTIATARIPRNVMTGHSQLTLSFDILHPASPASFGLSSDTREVGMALIGLKLKELH